MKTSNKMLVAALALLGISNAALGHIYTYSNHTAQDIQVRMQLGGFGEPWYIVGAKPYETKENDNNFIPADTTYELRFVAGEGPLDYSRKFGFCLARQQYRVQDENGKWGAWYAVAVRFVETEQFNKLVKASSLFAEGTKTAIAQAAQIAGSMLQTTTPTTGKEEIDEALSSATATAEPTSAVGKALEKTGEGLENVPLGKIVKQIGKMIGYSMCRERHFDIIEGTDGIEFISLAE